MDYEQPLVPQTDRCDCKGCAKVVVYECLVETMCMKFVKH
jgi:hypothetical protein